MKARREPWNVPSTGAWVGEAGEATSLHTHVQPPGTESRTLRLLPCPSYGDFGVCPICCEREPDTNEHVPPQGMGGRVATKTCKTCNDRFGHKYDHLLVARANGELVMASISANSYQGHRALAKVPLRFTREGAPVAFLDSQAPEIFESLERGERQELRFSRPAPDGLEIAVLKSAYLAACVLMGLIPGGARWDSVRGELMRARDAPRGKHQAGEWARSLRPWFQDHDPSRDPVEHIALAVDNANPATPRYFLLLTGRLSVPWPFGESRVVQSKPGQSRTFIPLSNPKHLPERWR